MNYTAVITTINKPNKTTFALGSKIDQVIVADEKTPEWELGEYGGNSVQFMSMDDDNSFTYQPPTNHYARKNIGYLLAMQQGTDCIYDTDDDNIPNENWELRTRECEAMEVEIKGWCNVYKCFTHQNIWPRGLPLTEINSYDTLSELKNIKSHIHQGLADKSPDVDAVWRLIFNKDTGFTYQRSVHLPPHTWSPFNSQSTWWFKEAFPLMYLPQYCSMRATDIIRSFVAQRCLWEMGYGVVVHSPSEVIQERNEHDLMKDFEDEIPIYLNADKIKVALDGLTMTKDLQANMYLCYTKLVTLGVLDQKELTSLLDWLLDIDELWGK